MLRIVRADSLEGIRPSSQWERCANAARGVISEVRAGGDSALVELTRRFDWPGMTAADIEVDMAEARTALAGIDPDVRGALELAALNISKFHIAQRPASWQMTGADGTRTGQRMVPLRSAGIYVPGGSAAYPSTVLMCVLAAKAAGVSEIIVCTPPGRDGSVNRVVLAAAALAGATRMFRVGGAQAVAAMAYSTGTIPAVDIIAGPGNAYVTAAKRAVMGDVRVDMLAGPSELMIVADDSADQSFVAADLIAQAEHDEMACCCLITTSAVLRDKVMAELSRQLEGAPRRETALRSLEAYSASVIAESLDMACGIADRFAPEHLELCCEGAAKLAERVSNAGTVFVGSLSAEAIGDYVAGPSHVLPTMGTARFRGTLSTADFMKALNVVECSKDGLLKLGPAAEVLARQEGLYGHAASVSVRLKSLGGDEATAAAEAAPAVKLDANECSADLLPGYKARMLASLMDVPFNRYPDADSDELREKLALKFGMDPARFAVGVGSDELILVLMLALRGKVDKVVSPWPSFSMYKVIAGICGLPFFEVGMGEDGLPDAKGLEGALADERALVFLCVPNNPTGDSMEGLVREKITSAKAYVAIDQAYAEFCGSDMSDLAEGRVVVLRTFSKARRLAGIRVGYSISSVETAELIRGAKLPYNVPSICERMALLSLEDESCTEEYVEANVRRRAELGDALGRMGLTVRGSSCNFLLVKGAGDEGRRLRGALADKGVLTRDFEERPGLLRITVGTTEENGRVLSAMAEALDEIGKAGPVGP